eukprot:4340369-Lingulodinium_polyedra.AAC.1
MRQGGAANVREWFTHAWAGQPESQQRQDLWHSAVSADMRLEEFRQQGAQALAWGLQHDDMLEGLLRQLAAAR